MANYLSEEVFAMITDFLLTDPDSFFRRKRIYSKYARGMIRPGLELTKWRLTDRTPKEAHEL
jgi:hypothetical protein